VGFTSFLKPRAETLAGEIEGIIDLHNVTDPKRRKLEAKPDLFFRLTYPTAEVKRVIQLLDQRFAQGGQTAGLFLFEGLKGVGKSHLLLLIYHLFKSPKEARSWLDRHGLTCRLPESAALVHNKFTDLPLLSIWDFVFEQVTGRRPPKSVLQPSLAEVEGALGGRHVVLIFDELEQGVRVLPDPAVRAQNIAFLQMLSEWGNRSNQVTLFASIYSDQEEPGATLKRVPSCRVQFTQAQDRARVVLHRIFENYLDFRQESAAPVIESYLNAWRRHLSSFDADAYRQNMLEAYPFTPDLLDIMLRRVPARGGFQNVRGALGFLAHLVRLTHTSADVITPGHANIQDREVAIRLSDLDPGSDLITRAQGNLEELKATPFAVEVASATLLYTVSGVDSRTHGATREELIRSVLRPGSDINDFEQSLRAFEKYAAYFHAREGRYFFDREENADAKVEFHSLRINDDRARLTLRALWRDELFKEPAAVIWAGPDETKAALEGLDKDRLRWILAARRLSEDDRNTLYHGLSMRNQVMLLEPRDEAFNLEAHPDVIKWAKRLLAVQSLVEMTREASRRAEYERIAREDRSHILLVIRRAGLSYVKFEARPNGFQIDEESLGTAASREEVLTHLSQKIYPPQFIAEHLSERLDQINGKSVREVEREYRSTLGFPVPTHAGSVAKAIRLLCKERKLGISHPLREVPVILQLAEDGGFRAREVDVSTAAVPSETLDFVEQRLRAGRVAPSQLHGRRELKEAGIEAFYYNHEGHRHQLSPEHQAFCLWSAFPDQTYQDSGARFASHFVEIHRRLEAVWRNTVQAIPSGRRILVTSDHGYVFFGHGHSAPRTNQAVRLLTDWFGGERWHALTPGEEPPSHPDLAVIAHRQVAMIRGRVQTHPPGPAGARLYKHGGLSLMEMLTPWIVLEPRPA